MLNHKKLCPVVPIPEKQNPEISFESLPFKLQAEFGDWPELTINGKRIPRRAGINSTGAGGVNAHLIVEEYNSPEIRHDTSLPVLFILSAKSKAAFNQYLLDWRNYIDTHPETDLFRLAYTLQTGREPMKYRFACQARDIQELSAYLETAAKGEFHNGCYTGEAGLPLQDTAKIKSWLHEKKLAQLALAWVKGTPVPWTHWYRDDRPRPLNQLPTYPFVQKTYWNAPAVVQPPVSKKVDKIEPIQKRIRSVVNKILEFDEGDEIDDQMNFSEMGFSSITIVTFIGELNRQFDLELRPTTAFDFPNIHELTRHVAQKVKQWEPPIGPKEPEDGLDSILRDFTAGKLDEQQTLDLIGK